MRKIYFAISLLAITFIIAGTINAATFNVTTQNDTLDANPGDGFCADGVGACSLRAAIGEANALAGADMIMLVPGTYTQTLVAANEDANLGGDWDITSVITILGTGEFSCRLEAAAAPGTATERVINVRFGGDLTLSRVMVRNGNFSGAMTASTSGAGIENNGTLTLDHVIVRDNRITSSSGGPAGAGIYNAGAALTLISTSVTANITTRQDDGNAFGGGISSSSQSTLTFTDSVVESNSVQAAGGFAFGAGIDLVGFFTANMTGGLVSNNTCSGSLGSNGCGIRVFSYVAAAVFNATGTTIRDNKGLTGATNTGVGIQLFTFAAPVVTLSATLNGVRVNNNTGNSAGVGINATVNGGNMNLNILNSAITRNTGGTHGGGVFVTNLGAIAPPSATATINITNSTISTNTSSGNGGGFTLEQPSSGAMTANLNHVTIAGNTGGTGGGIRHVSSGTVNMKNSVVGDNTGGTSPDISGGIVSGDYNHIESTAGTSISGTTTHNATGDALLGPLVEHVGGTVHLPSAVSPVVNTIPNGTNDCGTGVTTDQRAVLRPQGGGCDKGSVERAVSASIGGRVLTFDGRGIRNAVVTLSSNSLPQPLTAYTGSLGWYYFPDLPGEETYTLTASAKRYRFPDFPFPSGQGVYLIRDTFNLDFIAEPQSFGGKPSGK
jgi:CSLREA domain-containing protein